jgi:hypothetical protein
MSWLLGLVFLVFILGLVIFGGVGGISAAFIAVTAVAGVWLFSYLWRRRRSPE